MSSLELHPLAATLRWWLPAPLSLDEWAALMADYLSAIAGDCQAMGQVVIGHIKALALLPDGGFVRASAVSAAHPVDTEIRTGERHEAQELTLTVNVIVYGLPLSAARQIVVENAQSQVGSRAGTLVVESITREGAHAHDHDL